jgi:hypothetical protein
MADAGWPEVPSRFPVRERTGNVRFWTILLVSLPTSKLIASAASIGTGIAEISIRADAFQACHRYQELGDLE